MALKVAREARVSGVFAWGWVGVVAGPPCNKQVSKSAISAISPTAPTNAHIYVTVSISYCWYITTGGWVLRNDASQCFSRGPPNTHDQMNQLKCQGELDPCTGPWADAGNAHVGDKFGARPPTTSCNS